jgi:glycerophosphoryl diester phosphodiesterase
MESFDLDADGTDRRVVTVWGWIVKRNRIWRDLLWLALVGVAGSWNLIAVCQGQVSDAAPAGVVVADQTVAAPIVIAHRGASGYVPEHTTEAAVLAHSMGADYIEQDVVLSKDGIPVVLHDLTLNDVSDVAQVFPERVREDGRWYVMDLTLEELRRLNLTERRSENRAWKQAGTRFPLELGRFRIATLAEHLELIAGLNKSLGRTAGVYVEVKDPARHRAAGLDSSAEILKVLTAAGYDSAAAPVFVQCFDQAEVRRLRMELKCRLPLIWLTAKMPDEAVVREVSGFCDGLGVTLNLVVSSVTAAGRPVITSLVETAHRHGLQVHAWTLRADALPEGVKEVDLLLEWLTVDGGVDGIFSDQPDVVVGWRNRRLAEDGKGNPFRLLNAGDKQLEAAGDSAVKTPSQPAKSQN